MIVKNTLLALYTVNNKQRSKPETWTVIVYDMNCVVKGKKLIFGLIKVSDSYSTSASFCMRPLWWRIQALSLNLTT